MKPVTGRFAVVFVLILTISADILAANPAGHSLSFSAGLTLDLAPYGLEQVYYAFQAEYILPGTVSVGIKPFFAFKSDSFMFRFPVIGNVRFYSSDDDFFVVSGYLGCGPEIYRSEEHDTSSLIITGGLSAEAGMFYIDIPAVSAFRDYNTDSDLSATAGVAFRF